jgi:hypothetical protein
LPAPSNGAPNFIIESGSRFAAMTARSSAELGEGEGQQFAPPNGRAPVFLWPWAPGGMTNLENHNFVAIYAIEDSIPIRRDPNRINVRLVRRSSLAGMIAEFVDPLMDQPDYGSCRLRIAFVEIVKDFFAICEGTLRIVDLHIPRRLFA